MGKRPRTPHFITGMGDGNVHDRVSNINNNNNNNAKMDDAYQKLRGNNQNGGKDKDDKNSNNNEYYYYPEDRYNLRAARNERLQRLEEPLLTGGSGDAAGAADHWREDVFGNHVVIDRAVIGKPSIASGPWQVSAFAFLGMIVVISAVFLHFVSETSDPASSASSSPYHYRRRQRQRRKHQLRKKKTDEWSDDEEPIQNGARLVPDTLLPGMSSSVSPIVAKSPDREQAIYHPYFYQQPASHTRYATQDSRLRRTGNKEPYEYSPAGASAVGGGGQNSGSLHRKSSSGNNYQYAMPGGVAASVMGVVPTYKSPAPNNLMTISAPRIPQRGISPKNSYSSAGSHHQYGNFGESPTGFRSTAPLSGRNRVPSTPDAKDVFRRPPDAISTHHSSSGKSTSLLPTPPEESPLLMPKTSEAIGGPRIELNARPLQSSSNFSSFASGGGDEHHSAHSNSFENRERILSSVSNTSSLGFGDALDARSYSSHNSHNSYTMHSNLSKSSHHQKSLLLSPGNYEETPVIGNARKTIRDAPNFDDAALLPPIGTDDGWSHGPPIPFIPSLGGGTSGRESNSRELPAAPPRSILMDELRLVQMETGNSSIQWEVRAGSESHDGDEMHPHHEEDYHASFTVDDDESYSEEGSDISIPSGDPRKSIIHKRTNLTMSTDAATSLQSSINFDELQLQEVIGGGGFGQVWRATWRGTPVAVKVLTGSAQNTHIAKAILEEFKAEINLLKGMRHPNICLYMGACVDPPNRAIITELAANGSVWDALRLHLMPPYVAADGSPQGAWPLRLYMPDHHGAPPGSLGPPRLSAPIPPRGTWPWELVKRVSCGAARGMAYLHSGNPPVLHRDLKSANLLLDESYTTKVCDFGLSRLKAQARSMTGNCGTVQWMAPEVLANRSYDEKADIYSFGIIVWELLSRECPYEGMTAIQCALAVLNRDKRPEIPKWCPPGLHALIKSCVKKEPSERPTFVEIIEMLDAM